MLEVREQVRLSFRRLLEICLGSISYRLMRSLVTVAIIVLAIAFLAQIMVDGYLGRAARDTAMVRSAELTAYSRFLSQVSYVDTDEHLLRAFAALQPGGPGWDNLRRWGEFSDESLARFVGSAREAVRYLDFWEQIPEGRRALLFGQHSSVAVFDFLALPPNREAFEARLRQMKSIRLPGGNAAFSDFLRRWPLRRQDLERIKRHYGAAVRRVSEFCGAGGMPGKLRAALDARQTDAFFDALDGLGFTVLPSQRDAILRGFEFHERVGRAMEFLKAPPVRAGWTRQFHEPFNPSAALISCADSAARLDWVRRALAGTPWGEGFDATTFRQIAAEYGQRERMLQASHHLLARYGTTATLAERTVWLIVVSFLVCVVGIANAMLMSVLERFKEIATMKCLGARNQTIGFLFITESLIIGIVGGLVGVVLGFLIVFVRQTLAYGALLWERIPWADLGTAFGVCFCCSLLLAAIAAIYPAGVAARMAPMEAMRVD